MTLDIRLVNQVPYYQCPCGAKCKVKTGGRRFLDRHPSKCGARAEKTAADLAYTKKLAQGTRYLDDLDRNR